MEIPVAMWKEAQMNLCTLCRYWGAAKSGWGNQQRATYSMSLESYLLNTGEPIVDVKEGGK